MKRHLTYAALLLLMLALAGCAQPAQPAESGMDNAAAAYTFIDALGQEVVVDAPPQRVVALMGSFAEIWLLAGGGDSLVGVTVDLADDRDIGLPAHTATVGTYQEPNMEAILALDPDLVLLSAETVRTDNHVAMRDSLAAAGIPAAYFSVTHFEDYLAMLRICTELTGDEQAYSDNGLAVRQEIEEIIAGHDMAETPSVLLLISYSGGIRPQGSDTMTGRMLTQLGCHNIIDDHPSSLQDFSLEKVIELEPDHIFMIPMGNDDAAARQNLLENVESDPAWQSLAAVRNGRYILLPGDKFLFKPNANWAESYRYLAEILAE